MRVVEKPDPRIEHPDDIILRVTRTAICGSDLHLYPRPRARHARRLHVRSRVRRRRRGGRVRASRRSCAAIAWSCRSTSRAAPASSASAGSRLLRQHEPGSDIVGGVFGYSHTTGGYDGGQAEYVRVPFADVGPMKIPDDMDDEDVLFLSDILPTGYQAAEMGDIKEGETVVVFGCGPGRPVRAEVRRG